MCRYSGCGVFETHDSMTVNLVLRDSVACGGAVGLLDFLANNAEQLDLALEHVLLGDSNNARFGLMLNDKAVEIALRQIASDTQARNRPRWYDGEPYEYAKRLRHTTARRMVAVSTSMRRMAPSEASSMTRGTSRSCLRRQCLRSAGVFRARAARPTLGGPRGRACPRLPPGSIW